MFADFVLTEAFIHFEDEITDWEQAIVRSAAPLLKEGYVQQGYVDAMVESVKEYGPYIVIAPNIALPHARPEAGSIKPGFSFLKLNKPVAFSEEAEHQAQLLIALSCVNAETHMEMLQDVVTILSDDIKHKALFDATTVAEVLAIFTN